MTPMLAAVFWLCLAGVVYSYALYPPLIFVCSRLFGRLAQPLGTNFADFPDVSLLIVAHNEETDIERRIHNALEADYPRNKLQIVVASDGSTDDTVDIVRRFEVEGVRVLDYSIRRGKCPALNDSVPQLRGEIVVLSDANSFLRPDALRNLARWFADGRVGAVCGKLVLTNPHGGKNCDEVYWKYETFLKTCESRLGALLGSNGAIYAIRKELFQGLPNDTIVDDFVLPLMARLRTGCCIVYEPDAVAEEETPPWIGSEFQRRARIGAGGFQSIGLLRGLLHPRNGWVAFSFLSHKVLRWLCPFFLIGAISTNLLLLREPLYFFAFLLQVSFYAVAFAGFWLPAGKIWRPIRVFTLFATLNAALLVGFFRWLRGAQKAMWQPTERRTRQLELAN